MRPLVKKTVLHAAFIALTMPMSLYGLGLGEMTVKSSLDQPFLAEIELIDVGTAPLTGIRVGVADPENFAQIGMDRAAVLSLLHFKIEKNEQGKFIVRVQSVERMTEPYMELVVDLTWPHGQLYKAYTVLLDPPGYQLVSTTAQSSPTHYKSGATYHNEPGVINKQVITKVDHSPVSLNDAKKKATYGPTVTNENVWQIAQRYKTSEVTLPQVVLAIVGTNPDAFVNGNLNGLKVGVRLSIPSTADIQNVDADLATAEVMAHDSAWNDKTNINHVLAPPYINVQGSEVNQSLKNSEIPAIPKLSSQGLPLQDVMQKLIKLNSSLPIITSNQPIVQPPKPQSIEHNDTRKAEISITSAAVESVRESNALLMEQLRLLQDQNKKLQQKLDKRDKQIELFQKQMALMMKERLAIASQASSSSSNNQLSYFWPLLLLLLAAIGGGGFAYWYFRIREEKNKQSPYLIETAVEPHSFVPLAEPVQQESVAETTTQSVPEPINSKEMNSTVDVTKVDVVEESLVSEPVTEQATIKKRPRRKQSTEASKTDNDTEITKTEGEELIKQVETEKLGSEDISEPVLTHHEITPETDTIEKPQLNDPMAFSISTQDELAQNSASEEEHKAPEATSVQHEPEQHDVLEFESGLHQSMTKEQEQNTTKTPNEVAHDLDNSLDFYAPSVEEINSKKTKDVQNEPESVQGLVGDEVQSEHTGDEEHNLSVDKSLSDFFDEPEKNIETPEKIAAIDNNAQDSAEAEKKNTSLLKSTKALDTLLDLAKTYIGMEDFESARHSLDEVLEFGSEDQKIKAQSLLDEIKDKR